MLNESLNKYISYDNSKFGMYTEIKQTMDYKQGLPKASWLTFHVNSKTY